MASSKPTEEELVTRIRGEITDSLGYLGDTISKQREQAMQYYYGLPFGNEVAGRSQFVDTTVADTIEWIKPSLMRIFASGDNMVTFEPHGPEDVAAAKQATDYVNYVFQKDNNGWEILYSWFTDALLSKNGIVKAWWDETEEWNREEYSNLTEDELAVLLNDPNVEVVEHTPPGEPVPPSEFLISRESKSIEDARFVCHRVIKTLSELREMYPDKNLEVEDMKGGGDDMATFSAERLERYMYDKSAKYWEGWAGDETYGEDGLRTYWLHESYLRTDWDGDGITELRRVCTVGSIVLANEEIYLDAKSHGQHV